jgi:hypothetical protein
VSKARAKKKRRQRARAAGEADGKAPRAADEGGAKAPRAAGNSGATAPRAAVPQARGDVPRPQPVWAPFPLTEIGMAAGIVIFAIGFASNDVRTLAIGAIVLAVVTGELCLREHLSGFRSHTLLLAALPVAIVHGVVVLAITSDYRGPAALAVDLAAGGALAWWLQGRFRRAHEHRLTP